MAPFAGMIQIHSSRADHVSNVARLIFQRPQHSAKRGLISKHLIDRLTIKVLMLNDSVLIQNRGELVSVVQIVLARTAAAGGDDLANAIATIVVQISPQKLWMAPVIPPVIPAPR